MLDPVLLESFLAVSQARSFSEAGRRLGVRQSTVSQHIRKLEDAAAPEERFVHAGSEIYAWHPEGVARSKLWALLAGRGLGVTATARNWTTVTKLLELATRT